MGRGLSSTYVDAEGSVIWIRSTCAIASTSATTRRRVQKVFAQIDGGPVSDTLRAQLPSIACHPASTGATMDQHTSSFVVT